MKNVSLKVALKNMGFTEIELSRNYCEQSGFAVKDGQLYYINSGDVRMRRFDGQLNVMYRTAQHRRDWTGGINQWDFIRKANELGMKVTTCSYKVNGN